jgi:hypothetical protein
MGVNRDTVHRENKMLRWYRPAERRDNVDDRRTNSLYVTGKHRRYGDEE